MFKKFRHIVFYFLILAQFPGLSQTTADDTSTITGSYYVLIFNSSAVDNASVLVKPQLGDYYRLNYNNYGGLLTKDEASRYIEGENITHMSKDSLLNNNVTDLSTVTITFLKNDRSCWLKASDIESKQRGDTLYITRFALSLLKVKYEKKQACENDPLPISPILTDNFQGVEFSSPDGLVVNRYSGTVLPAGQPAGTYSIRYTSTYCLENISDTIAILPKPYFTIEKNRRICEGKSLELAPEALSNDSYSWSTGALTKSINVSTPGNYALTAENEFGCRQTDTFHVELKTIRVEQIDYAVAEADCYKPGSISFKQLNITNGKLPYKYSFENRISGQIFNDTSSLREGDYILTIEDGEGCRTAFQHAIAIKKDCLNNYPVFSPNTDGVDDDYYIPYEGEAIVYDRNGIERHRFMAPDYWDGKDKNGNQLPMGTYVIVVGKKEVINITIIK